MPVTVAQLYSVLRSEGEGSTFLSLRDVLPGNLADDLKKPGTFTRRLGWALKNHADARFGNKQYYVTRAGETSDTHAALWEVRHGN